ncbi:methyltransferase domain-containing protein [Conexibacter sp. SYSU D00693]|uniref:methyltransferase domain-containing protein n=1 Tax=Conexibacter sp. SYSU D00693 TaxID=2812560 RepID=UPI00196A48F6|nr:methyltransferase domain-containing protein [Conexibacter sp. SYSU D00693]
MSAVEAPLVEGGEPATFFAAALAGAPLQARMPDGRAIPVPVARWTGAVQDADDTVLARVVEPVIDVGCGPGRHVAALVARGVLALGIDASRVAVRHARRRGAPALHRDVFGAVPAAGTWHTALLLDGNIGIGGDPVRLLERLGELLSPSGQVLAEVAAPGTPTGTVAVRLECAGARSAPLRWATVAVDGVARVAAAAGLRVVETVRGEDRFFVALAR